MTRNGNDNASMERNCEGLGSHIFSSHHFHSRIYFFSALLYEMTTGARVSFSGSTITLVKTESALIQLELRCALQQKLSAEGALFFHCPVRVDDWTAEFLHAFALFE